MIAFVKVQAVSFLGACISKTGAGGGGGILQARKHQPGILREAITMIDVQVHITHKES